MKGITEILLGAAVLIGLSAAPALAVPTRGPHATSPHVYNHERQRTHYYGGFFHPDHGWHHEHEHGDWGFHHGLHRDWDWRHRHWYGGHRFGPYFGPVYHYRHINMYPRHPIHRFH